MPRPDLYIFAISHYCEKARWALDYLGIDHRVVHLAPGAHGLEAKRLGAHRSSLPILVADGECVQGSAEILDWAQAQAQGQASARGRSLTPSENVDEGRETERRLDEVMAVHIRRYYYSEALVEHPESVRPIFTRNLRVPQKLLVCAAWSQIRKRMIAAMDLGRDQGLESRGVVERELDWIDGRLSDGRSFLTGDRFSRTDLAAASLLAPLASPPEHPTYAELEIPPRVSGDLERWEQRPCLAWTREMYRQYR